MIKKIDPFFYQDYDPVVVDYIHRLESVIDEYQSKDKRHDKINIDEIPTFKINTAAFDLIQYDSFQSHKFPMTPYTYLSAILKTAKLFWLPKHPYDYVYTIIMLYIYPLDCFYRDEVLKFCYEKGHFGKVKTGRMLSILTKLGYISYNKRRKSDLAKDWMWFITPKGKEMVSRFMQEVYEQEINIDIYDKNFKRLIRQAKGRRGKKYGFIRRHKDIFGEPVPTRFKRKKSRDRDSYNVGQGESSEPEIGG